MEIVDGLTTNCTESALKTGRWSENTKTLLVVKVLQADLLGVSQFKTWLITIAD